MVPLGFLQVAASIKLNSRFIDELPEDPAAVQKALAFSGSAMTALSIVLMLALKPLFGDIASFNPFPWLAGALVPLAAAVFFLQRRLASATEKEPPPTPDSPAGGAGGFIGILQDWAKDTARPGHCADLALGQRALSGRPRYGYLVLRRIF